MPSKANALKKDLAYRLPSGGSRAFTFQVRVSVSHLRPKEKQNEMRHSEMSIRKSLCPNSKCKLTEQAQGEILPALP